MLKSSLHSKPGSQPLAATLRCSACLQHVACACDHLQPDDLIQEMYVMPDTSQTGLGLGTPAERSTVSWAPPRKHCYRDDWFGRWPGLHKSSSFRAIDLPARIYSMQTV